MNRDEQTLIQNLFGKLSEVERQAPPREADADRFIQDSVARQPAAPYYMAQTIIVQEQALEAAHARIQELESQPKSSGGFFGSLFGNSQAPRQQQPMASAQPNHRQAGAYGQPGAAPAAGPWGGGAQAGYGQAGGMGAGAMGAGRMGGGGGGFLAGAAQTAMGVAGGVMLGSMLTGMFAGDDAAAGGEVAEAPAEPEQEVADMGADDFGGDDFDDA
ncbi:DUF2076 domain-containing protein (plasmid) [Aureimonas ureilytica]|uniref:DUF2076 domain-containing protein n=1 Tax=Aureimonas ureilytica TaxID=401562 RepID=UPI003CF9484B